ncbi:hypothetical protein AQEC111735_12005 [Aquirufa ecclesiirivi]
MVCAAPAVSVVSPVIRSFVAVPPTTLILELVPVAPPVAEANEKVPVPAVPVKINFDVKLATPFTKSPAPVNLLVPDNPVIAPVKLLETVTLFTLASNVVTVFAQKSCAVKVFVPVKAVPFTCGLVKDAANLDNVLAEVVVLNRSAPTEVTPP